MAQRIITEADAAVLRAMREHITAQGEAIDKLLSGDQKPPISGGNPVARDQPNGDAGFWSRITGSTPAGIFQWAYSTEQVHKTAAGHGKWTATAGGVVTSSGAGGSDRPAAWNTLEDMNGASGPLGIGFSPPPGFELQPIPNGVIVWMRFVVASNGAVEFQFTAPNGIDGKCP